MDKESTLARRLANAFDDQISRLRRVMRDREDRDIAEALGIKPKPAPQEQRRRSADELAQGAKEQPTKHDYVPPDVSKPAPTIVLPGLGGGGKTAKPDLASRAAPPEPTPQPERPADRPTMTLAVQESATARDGWCPLIRLVGTLETVSRPAARERTVVEGLIERMRPEEQRQARERLEESRATERTERIKNGLQQRSDTLERLTTRLVQSP